MPPKKREARSVRIGLGHLELGILEYLAETEDRSFAESTRKALRYFALENLDLDALQLYMTEKVISKIEDPVLRSGCELASDAFFKNAGDEIVEAVVLVGELVVAPVAAHLGLNVVLVDRGEFDRQAAVERLEDLVVALHSLASKKIEFDGCPF